MKKSILFIVVLSGIIAINACKKDSTDYAAQAVCTGAVPTYSGEIASIIDTHCGDSNCHSANASKAGINLSTYALASSQFLNNNDISPLYITAVAWLQCPIINPSYRMTL